MEFKGKRMYEIIKKLGFDGEETRTEDCLLGYPTFREKKDGEGPVNKTGKNKKVGRKKKKERKQKEYGTCRSRE